MMTESGPILKIALPTPLRRLFDYLPPQDVDINDIKIGARVKVPFGSRTLIGIIINSVQKSNIPLNKLKAAIQVLDDEAVLPEDVFKICQWAAQYYHYPIGEVLAAAIPVALRKGKALLSDDVPLPTALPDKKPVLNSDQESAVQAILKTPGDFNVYLLDGVTGSGKTEVYLRAIESVLNEGKQVLVLVPEISLTPQTISRFERRFQVPIVALHSSMTDKKRLQAWCAARDARAKIVIGTRSAVFTAFDHLGLIIVDEEHDHSFKQQDRFRYHARDLSIMRARDLQIPIVLGSATPSLESLQNAKLKRYHYLALPHRAGNAELPTYQLVNMKDKPKGLSDELLKAMHEHLNNGNQVMLFLNRRGFAPVLYCTSCQYVVECRRCDARMVYHDKPARLQCHHCDAKQTIPVFCPKCKDQAFEPIGFGTQRLEQVIEKEFADFPIYRIDRDSVKKKGDFEKLFAEIHKGEPAILLGTQMLAKGHHFPDVTLVGILDSDSGLFSADFRAVEQMGQLLLQVSGRAGRAEKKGTVMIQTACPDHPLLETLIHEGYSAFANQLLEERESALLPPFSYFALIKAESNNEKKAIHFLDQIRGRRQQLPVDLPGPVPAVLSKKKGLYVKHLLVKSQKRGALQQYLSTLVDGLDTKKKTVRWVVDVDPLETV